MTTRNDGHIGSVAAASAKTKDFVRKWATRGSYKVKRVGDKMYKCESVFTLQGTVYKVADIILALDGAHHNITSLFKVRGYLLPITVQMANGKT
jgi:hypothetical protein